MVTESGFAEEVEATGGGWCKERLENPFSNIVTLRRLLIGDSVLSSASSSPEEVERRLFIEGLLNQGWEKYGVAAMDAILLVIV